MKEADILMYPPGILKRDGGLQEDGSSDGLDRVRYDQRGQEELIIPDGEEDWYSGGG